MPSFNSKKMKTEKATMFYGRIPTILRDKVVAMADSKDLKLVAVLKQALELWVKENAA